MKTFAYYDYQENCPLAVEVENLLNDCNTPLIHLEKIEKLFSDKGMTPRHLFEFIVTCIGYWSETLYYDDRNKFAVFGCREIAKVFPYVKDYCKDEDMLRNAYGFTMSAHRHLQNEMFKTILEYFKKKEDSLWIWWDESRFVYSIDGDCLVPYKN